MNKITKRIVAGASAVALLASAVGIDRLAELFVKTSYAVGVGEGKTAKSTGFNNLEQDTDSDGNYNTGYGLHTNKTATALADGRTFDVNLESWYVGENPVDVATILDASGSMAWTVDTLSPLEISFNYDDVAKYLKDENDLNKYSIDNKETRLLTAIQDENGGYLPQEVVDLILDKTKTDNTKLSYSGYKYYVYENRSSVSEFVPLGYWDGGEHTETFKPIGYYPFDGSLANSMGGTATYIKHAADTENKFDENQTPTVTIEPTYVDRDPNTLDLKETAENGGLMLDINCPDTFTIAMRIKSTVYAQAKGTYEEIPILYIGNLDGNNYIKVVRSASDARNIRVYENDKQIINYSGSSSKHPFHDDDWVNLCLSYDGSQVKIMVYDKDTTTALSTSTFTLTSFSTNDAKIIIGGDIDGRSGDYSPMQLTELCVFKSALNDDQLKRVNNSNDIKTYIKMKDIGETDNLAGYYDFGDTGNGSHGKLDNLASTENGSLTFIEQAVGGTFSNTPIIPGEAKPDYSSDSHSGSRALNVSQTAKLGAVLLDTAPTDSTFTLSFAVKKTEDSDMTNDDKVTANLLYIGDMNATDYYQIKRREGSSNNRLAMCDKDGKTYVNINKVFGDTNYKVITIVVDGKTVTQYKDGEKYTEDSPNDLLEEITADDLALIIGGLWDDGYNGADILIDDLYVFDKALDADQVAAVAKATEGQTEFAILPSALSGSGTCGGYHATTSDGKTDIAQISERLAQNPNDDERRGWYYVNSHSKWADIEDCLASGKQYIGIYDKDKDNGIDNVAAAGKDIATIPSAYNDTTNTEYASIKESIEKGNTDTKEGSTRKLSTPPENERSIRFYVDSQNHLRCFAWSGSTSKDGDIRTFCSLVYEKGYNDDMSKQITKYEELNNALNTFYQKIAEKSDLSNNAVVRFSTNSAVATITKEDKTEDQINAKINTTNTNLQKLIMKDWTNWSDYYQTDMKAHEGTEGYEPKTTDYLKDLLIPAEGETALGVNNSAITSGEYPYVMTGGTYTWTGLKAFYDNMVKNEDSQTAKDIANDARDKYLIIFTDGRDNTQDYNVSELDAKANYTNYTDKMAGSPVYNSGSNCKGTKYVNDYNPYADDPTHKVGFSIKNYNNHWTLSDTSAENLVQKFVTEDHEIASDGDLAEAWADKLKDEGYTIYCVMMASGSISPTANADEYNKAKNFLKSLSGSNELDAQIAQMQADNEKELNEGSTKPDGLRDQQKEIEALRDKYVIVVDPTADDAITVTGAFEQILEQIQLPRNDYTVQDYIDPRFDLIGKAYVNDVETEVIYHLGANGAVTFTDTNNNKLETITVTDRNGTKVTIKSGTTIGNIIDHINETGIVSLPYTPMNSYMVNRKTSTDSGSKDGYDTGNIGTGYIYYDNVKDMYYLRWTDQIIPMENKAFDTADSDGKKLDVWSATIRLKAKDDFIGGNNILTNGNEAGENLVYSDATIDNMTDNPKLYFPDYEEGTEITYREKLAALSGTDRKINAVDAGGVSQAVYGNGIDIPSSGFPRTTVNVRLLPLNANNLNDVIYMGEVVSPTMMLADLENGYMTGSYYLQYLERYAYRVYGDEAGKMPLIELLNKWLKIDDDEEASKTFTIPYIYLPDPEYKSDGTLAKVEGTDKVKLENSTGWDSDKQGDDPNFADLNLRDVTGFITYTWKRNDDGEEQQKTGEFDASGNPEYDVTIDYVVKNTNQIKYNLQLTFTPLKEGKLPTEFKLGENFIDTDKFFNIRDDEFNVVDVTNWSATFTRADYLKAMIKEEHTYTPHIKYDTTKQKWQLLNGGTEDTKDVYDWDKDYKKVVGDAQLEDDLKLYTSTTDNVNFADADGVKIEGTTATAAPVSLAANTTYTKDVVNAALALELFVDGKYLNNTDSKIKKGNTFTFEATRYYDDPIDPLPYDTTGKSIGANTGVDGKKYKLTFKVTDIPTDVKENEISKVWAKLTEVKVEASTAPDDYKLITDDGYTDVDALPIGTYVISVTNDEMGTADSQYDLGKAVGDISNAHFKYLKVDTDSNSYEHSKFPENVYQVSESAADSTEDGEYQIWNNTTDYSKKNIAESNRTKDTDAQTATFYFGTVKDGSGDKGVSVKDYLKENPEAASAAEFKNDYAKDRLGIIMLSADNNSLAITKEITNYKDPSEESREWTFTVTIKTDDTEWINDHGSSGIMYDLYTRGSTSEDWTKKPDNLTATFTDSTEETTHTLTVEIKLTHNQKVILKDLPDGDWQVTEAADVFCTPHNNANGLGEDEWRYQSSAKTGVNTLTPISQVDYINEFPYELPSAGGSGTLRFVLFGTLLTAVGAILFAVLYYDRRKRARK